MGNNNFVVQNLMAYESGTGESLSIFHFDQYPFIYFYNSNIHHSEWAARKRNRHTKNKNAKSEHERHHSPEESYLAICCYFWNSPEEII